MKLGSLKEGGRDGTLIVVSRDLTRAVRATGIADTLQRALEEYIAQLAELRAEQQAWDRQALAQSRQERQALHP